MADQDGTKQVTDINSDVSRQREIEEGKRWFRETSARAADEIIEDAVNMLSFFSLDLDEDATLCASAVSAQADAIVGRLRKAQEFCRSAVTGEVERK